MKQAELAVKKLLEKHLHVATAESCTGGWLGGAIVSVAGASDVYGQGIISYSNEAKMRLLKVRPETLKAYGAVSHQTAGEMAEGTALLDNADIGISTTGIAGPGGGTPEKPVGLVYIGIWCRGTVKTYENHFAGDRDQVRTKTVERALEILCETIDELC